jgi:1,4-dihydroxy-2-naphthoate octaprenyltransferase
MKKSTFLHLRIPFSFFLMPIFLFAAAISQKNEGFWIDFSLLFFIFHALVYPASNGFNSYYDRDEGPIGGLKSPPKVEKELLFYSLVLDAVGFGMAFWFLGGVVALGVLVYGLVSKAYSHPFVRLKSKPFLGLLSVVLFQGGFVVLVVVFALSPEIIFTPKTWIAAGLASLMLFGSYPMTQIYQHEEDSKRGDKTISLLLGIKGTFVFTMLFFGLTSAGFGIFFLTYYSMGTALAFFVGLFPVLFYFMWWFYVVLGDASKANFENTMRLNLISALMLNLFFGYLCWVS